MAYPLHIVIPTHGRPRLLKRTLESLAECSIPRDLVQTIVIENGGRNGADRVVAETPSKLKACYQFTPEGNKSHALNVALEGIDDGLIVLFDDDIRLEPHTLEAYAAAAGEYGEGHYFGGPFGADYEKEPPEWLKDYLPPSAVGWKMPATQPTVSPGKSFIGFNWAVFASDLAKTGPFNPEVGPSCDATGQETEMQLRLRKKHVAPVYLPGAKVWHYVPIKRCSVEWAISRTYRAAAGAAIQARDKQYSQLKYTLKLISWHCNPWWMMNRVLSKYAKDDQAKFRAACLVARRSGKLDTYYGFPETQISRFATAGPSEFDTLR